MVSFSYFNGLWYSAGIQ